MLGMELLAVFVDGSERMIASSYSRSHSRCKRDEHAIGIGGWEWTG
jgi:hypothetical protein